MLAGGFQPMDRSFKTVRSAGQDEFIERKSRFIGYISPAASEEEAQAFITQIKKKHHDASHNVSAYVLREGMLKRYSDDGEPQGTAGVPVLQVLEKENIVDVVAVVTRYFGGTLLGAGGLVRAYSHGCKIGLDSAGVKVMRPCSILGLEMDYTFYGAAVKVIERYGARILDTVYSDIVRAEVIIPVERCAFLEQGLIEMSAAQITVEPMQEEFFDME